MVLTLLALTITCSGVHCGLKYQHCPMKRTPVVDQKVAYCTHIIQTKLMLKNRRQPQNSMFTATEGPTDMPLVVLV